MINLNLLSTFYQVARLGSFSQAADEIGLFKAIVSKHIKELEAAYNTKLMHRTTLSLSLTDEGRYVFKQCLKRMGTVEKVELFLSKS